MGSRSSLARAETGTRAARARTDRGTFVGLGLRLDSISGDLRHGVVLANLAVTFAAMLGDQGGRKRIGVVPFERVSRGESGRFQDAGPGNKIYKSCIYKMCVYLYSII